METVPDETVPITSAITQRTVDRPLPAAVLSLGGLHCYRAMYCQCCGTDVYGDVCQSCIDAIQAIKTIEKFGGTGLIVSVAYGPCGEHGDQYSVTVMDPTSGKEFDKPFGASEFGTIAEILDTEVPAMLAR